MCLDVRRRHEGEPAGHCRLQGRHPNHWVGPWTGLAMPSFDVAGLTPRDERFSFFFQYSEDDMSDGLCLGHAVCSMSSSL